MLKRKASSGDAIYVKPNELIWSNDEQGNKFSFQWGPLDDVVMGGASKSSINEGNKWDGIWRGLVTTANNGGFAGKQELFIVMKKIS
jgi:hypothetical protein